MAQGLGLSAIIPLISLNEMFLLWDSEGTGAEDEAVESVLDDEDHGDDDEESGVRYTTEEEYDR